MVRAAGRVDRLASRLKEEVRALDAYLPVYRLQTLAAAIDAAEWNGRVAARLILVLTVVAVALAVFGLYTVTAHGVTLRTREIGVRMALGAGPPQIVAMVLRRAAGQLALGFGVGLLLVLAWSRIFTTGRPEVAVLQWQPLALVATALAVAAAIACSAPACRALRLDPVSAIRHE
jgi:ABC-type antimicrobial peptide transport system permease subunit